MLALQDLIINFKEVAYECVEKQQRKSVNHMLDQKHIKKVLELRFNYCKHIRNVLTLGFTRWRRGFLLN